MKLRKPTAHTTNDLPIGPQLGEIAPGFWLALSLLASIGAVGLFGFMLWQIAVTGRVWLLIVLIGVAALALASALMYDLWCAKRRGGVGA